MLFMPIEQFAEYARLLNDWQPLAAVFIIAMLFALFPDVDTNSKAQDIFFWAVFPLDIILIWQGYLQAAAYLGLVAMLPIVTHHRGVDTCSLGIICRTASFGSRTIPV